MSAVLSEPTCLEVKVCKTEELKAAACVVVNAPNSVDVKAMTCVEVKVSNCEVNNCDI